MHIAACTFHQAPEILEIFNDAILHSTALYDYQLRTMANMETWFEAKQNGNFPVIGAFADDGQLAGFVSYGSFRERPAYKYSVEHSVYVRHDRRGQGLGRRLLDEIIAAATAQDYHMLIGGIDSANEASVRLHRRAGFSQCGRIKQAGFKFGRWLDLDFYQRILPTPAAPQDG